MVFSLQILRTAALRLRRAEIDEKEREFHRLFASEWRERLENFNAGENALADPNISPGCSLKTLIKQRPANISG